MSGVVDIDYNKVCSQTLAQRSEVEYDYVVDLIGNGVSARLQLYNTHTCLDGTRTDLSTLMLNLVVIYKVPVNIFLIPALIERL